MTYLGSTLSALKWNYLGTAARVALQVVSQIFLARLLGPDPFGLFALCLLLANLVFLLAEMGITSALVQTDKPTEREIGAVFCRMVLAGALALAAFSYAASLIAVVTNEPRMTELAWVIGVGLCVQLLSATFLALLKRKLAFREVQVSAIVGHVLGYWIVGLVVAHAWGGVWALLLAWITQLVSSGAIMAWQARQDFHFALSLNVRRFTKFGRQVVGTNVANWIVENADNLIVGRVLGAQALGGYSVAYNIVRYPTNHLVATLQAVLFPAASRTNRDLQTIASTYLNALSGVCLILFPLLAIIAGSSESIVLALFGAHWAFVHVVLLPLSVAMCSHAVMAVAGPLLWGAGEVGRELRVQWVTALVLVLLLMAFGTNIVNVAWTVSLVYFARAVWMSLTAAAFLNVSTKQVYLACRGGARVGLLTGLIAFGSQELATSWALAPFPAMLSCVALSTLSAVGLFLWVPKVFLRAESRALLSAILANRNGLLGWWIARL